jgi:hypothetical protein
MYRLSCYPELLVGLVRIDVEHPLPSRPYPFFQYGNEAEDKSLHPAFRLDIGENLRYLADQMGVEVLAHSRQEQEGGVFFEERAR